MGGGLITPLIKSTYFPDRGCVRTLRTLYVYATVPVCGPDPPPGIIDPPPTCHMRWPTWPKAKFAARKPYAITLPSKIETWL